MEYLYTKYGWFIEVEKKPKFLSPEELTRIWSQTPLFERPFWQRTWFFIFGWPKRFKPTGYKAPILHMKDLRDAPFIINGDEHKFEILIPNKL